MPGAKAASTGRTDGPLLQKPLPQSLRYCLTNSVAVFCKTHFPSGIPSEDQLCGQVLLLKEALR